MVQLPVLGSRSTYEEISRHYGTLASAYHQHVPAIYDELDQISARMLILENRMLSKEEIAQVVEASVFRARASLDERMRAIAESVPATEELREVAREEAEAIRVKAENEDLRQQNEELKERRRDSLHSKRELRNLIVSGIVAGVVVAAIAGIGGWLAGRAFEHSSSPAQTQSQDR